MAVAWRAGASFDSLVAKYHDPIEERSIPNPFPRTQLPEPYQKAVEGRPTNAIVDPFEIEDAARQVPKFVVLQLTSAEPEREPSLAEFRQQIPSRARSRRRCAACSTASREAPFSPLHLACASTSRSSGSFW